MTDNRVKKNNGMPPFLSALIGAIVGGLLVYFLAGGFSAKNNDKSEDNSPNSQTQSEDQAKEKNKKEQLDKSLGKINSKDSNTSMESLVVKKSIDSVVGITTKAEVTQQTFFGPQSGYVEGIGSGSIVSSDGYILTNSHVVSDDDASEISVLFNDGTMTPAKLVWNDSTLDLAIIKVEKDNLPVMELADSDDVKVGDRVVAIGNPLGCLLYTSPSPRDS